MIAPASSILPLNPLASNPPASNPLASRAQQKQQQIDYRLMVDAIQSGDLEAAQQSYGRLTGNAPKGASGNAHGGALTRIGALLHNGDLTAAQKALDGLQSKALDVLHQAAADQVARKDFAAAMDPRTVPLGQTGRTLNLSI